MVPINATVIKFDCLEITGLRKVEEDLKKTWIETVGNDFKTLNITELWIRSIGNV